MSWTKKQLIDYAFNELGLSSYTYDMMPEQFEIALNKLDAMLALWNSTGINIGYNLSDINTNNINQDSGLADYMNEAVYLNLAIRLAPSYGKMVAPETKISAKQAYNQTLNKLVKAIPMQRDYFAIAGAGNRYNRQNLFLPQPVDGLEVSNSTNLTIEKT
jgi:hypothetical protein